MEQIMKKPKNYINIIFLIFALRIMLLIIVPPFIGVANNGDFQRFIIPGGGGLSGKSLGIRRSLP